MNKGDRTPHRRDNLLEGEPMQLRPNVTLVKGRVESVTRCADGWGAEVELEVTENVSTARERDFIRPPLGQRLKVFTADPELLPAGATMQVQLSLLGGPQGSRPVVESAEEIRT